MTTPPNSNAGHRERIRQKFLDHGLEVFQDYEALELILDFVARQKDMKPVAKSLVERFGSLSGMLAATPEQLTEINGLGPAAVTLLTLIKQVSARSLIQSSKSEIYLQKSKDLIDACRLSMGNLPDEEFHLFSFKTNFSLIKEDIIAKDTSLTCCG